MQEDIVLHRPTKPGVGGSNPSSRAVGDSFTSALLAGIRASYCERYAVGGTADQKRRARNKRKAGRR